MICYSEKIIKIRSHLLIWGVVGSDNVLMVFSMDVIQGISVLPSWPIPPSLNIIATNELVMLQLAMGSIV